MQGLSQSYLSRTAYPIHIQFLSTVHPHYTCRIGGLICPFGFNTAEADAPRYVRGSRILDRAKAAKRLLVDEIWLGLMAVLSLSLLMMHC
jgi:hypothetical protein